MSPTPGQTGGFVALMVHGPDHVVHRYAGEPLGPQDLADLLAGLTGRPVPPVDPKSGAREGPD